MGMLRLGLGGPAVGGGGLFPIAQVPMGGVTQKPSRRGLSDRSRAASSSWSSRYLAPQVQEIGQLLPGQAGTALRGILEGCPGRPECGLGVLVEPQAEGALGARNRSSPQGADPLGFPELHQGGHVQARRGQASRQAGPLGRIRLFQHGPAQAPGLDLQGPGLKQDVAEDTAGLVRLVVLLGGEGQPALAHGLVLALRGPLVVHCGYQARPGEDDLQVERVAHRPGAFGPGDHRMGLAVEDRVHPQEAPVRDQDIQEIPVALGAQEEPGRAEAAGPTELDLGLQSEVLVPGVRGVRPGEQVPLPQDDLESAAGSVGCLVAVFGNGLEAAARGFVEFGGPKLLRHGTRLRFRRPAKHPASGTRTCPSSSRPSARLPPGPY
ncbi:MAG: hypothetical protein MZV63_57510 [Marinilabiliales bacterium]|nr:hypothetical protein [Marinilabiliales bacterium]